MELNNPKIIRAWGMYDWANSVYSLVITSAIFPIYYQSVTSTEDSDVVDFFGFEIVNSVLYSYGLSFSFLVVAAILPLLSGVADYSGKKKLFLKIFMYLGAISCMALYLFQGAQDVELAIIASIMASIGYSGGLVFYDAFLPEIATNDRMDKVSAKGYSLGYIGSVLLLIINLALIMNHEALGYDDQGGELTRISFLTVGLWWIGFSQITFKYLQDNVFGRKPEGKIWKEGYKELLKVWNAIKEQANIKTFLLSFFFYNMGVQTVMYLAATFGSKELQLEASKLIITVLIINLVAIAGAFLFAKISSIRGNKYSLKTMILIWIFICFGAYFVTNEYHFYALAFVVGMVMGGIQSLSRATFGKLIPEDTIDHASYFSFYNVTYMLSVVFGTFSFGFIEQITGDLRNSVLALAAFFIIGLVFLIMANIPFVKAEK
ncbi:MAG: MFS transporter [Flavobacteriaceae bacterium]|nr:MFS transporter [Flavobacteriaceae bacterium]